VTTFEQARSEQEREMRRRAIFDDATVMLAELPVAEISLNELSPRTGLARSSVLHHFESREAVLPELLDPMRKGWLAEPAAAVDPGAPLLERGDRLAAVLAGSLAARPVLCDLIGAQGRR
jgi:AcrR family transcriptional regulator